MRLQVDEEFVPVHPSHRGTAYRKKGKKKKKKLRARRDDGSPGGGGDSPGYIKRSPENSPGGRMANPMVGGYSGVGAAGRRN